MNIYNIVKRRGKKKKSGWRESGPGCGHVGGILKRLDALPICRALFAFRARFARVNRRRPDVL